MRCGHCHSYIPEALTQPLVCPNCGGVASATETKRETPFAPFFTIKTYFTFGTEVESLDPSEGSISFGPEGFSVVWENGKNWEKIPYRDLSSAQVEGSAAKFNVRDLESKIMFFHSWLPRWFKTPLQKRAQIFVDLLKKVKEGLTPQEVAMYQQRFR